MDIRLRDGHRIIWYTLIVLLSFILALSFEVKPEEPEMLTVMESTCEAEVRTSEAARYSICDDAIYVSLKRGTRLPALEIEITLPDGTLKSKRFDVEREIKLDLSEFEYKGATVSVREVVRDSVIDEFELTDYE
jgi:hypothetical protein